MCPSTPLPLELSTVHPQRRGPDRATSRWAPGSSLSPAVHHFSPEPAQCDYWSPAPQAPSHTPAEAQPQCRHTCPPEGGQPSLRRLYSPPWPCSLRCCAGPRSAVSLGTSCPAGTRSSAASTALLLQAHQGTGCPLLPTANPVSMSHLLCLCLHRSTRNDGKLRLLSSNKKMSSLYKK